MSETVACDIDELRTLFLFEKLADDQLDWLCANGRVEHHDAGVIAREGDPATCFIVLLDGTIALSRAVGGEDVETTRTDQKGAYAGAWSAFVPDSGSDRYNATVRAITPVRVFTLDAADFATVMRQWFPMAVHLLEGLFYGSQRTQNAVNQRERLLALGSLSAGLTHELNNPAAAAVRATSSLRERVAGMR
ncbi:MAG: cyclic nucleotide-binding domain-containing protein, partial [Williamsia herbipolensis]|nr:cyclic nucleotide-binding domain-containing protein [Williamsia herbipolensis]